MDTATMEGAPGRPPTREDAPEVFGKVFDLYSSAVRGCISRQAPFLHAEDLEDLQQIVWIAVWRALPSYGHRAALGTWLAGLTRNVVCSWLRGRFREEQGRHALARMHDGDEEMLFESADMKWRWLREVLAELPLKEQAVVCLRYFEGLSDQEIAQVTGLAMGTVKGRIRAGLAHLRAALWNNECILPAGGSPGGTNGKPLRRVGNRPPASPRRPGGEPSLGTNCSPVPPRTGVIPSI